ncbi:MAG TPA: nucleotidyltransferase domain-containing protein, partial [Bacteroidetes bacterium]|nr:nucleotidyltransferase domain-containing protein [Bacteroidota bacterium]
MAKIPKTPSEIFGEFTDDFKRIFETDLTAIILYGSGAKGDYVHKKSDINFMIVLTEPGIHNLFLTFDVLKKWRKRAVSTPLFLTKEYIESSLDSFPLEFWEMKKFHQIVYGDDVLKKIEISRSDLRLQCEREVKGKLLHLQQNFLNSEKKPHRLRALLVLSIPTFGTLFN